MLLAALAMAAPAPAQEISIEGRVWVDLYGDGADPDYQAPPLAGVAVGLWRDGIEIQKTTTDEAGSYRFGRLETGAYKVAVDESTLPEGLGLGPASFLERSYLDVVSSIRTADFSFVPDQVIARLRAAAAAGDSPEEARVPRDRNPLLDELGDRGGPSPAETDADESTPGETVPEELTPGGSTPGAERTPDEAPDRPDGEPKRPSILLWVLAVVVGVILVTLVVRRLTAPGPPKSPALTPAGPRSLAELTEVEGRLGDLSGAEPAAVIELFNGYRDVQAWSRMDSVYRSLPEAVRRTPVVRQQRAFALNRAGDHEAAERLLRDLIAEQGASPESCGILGRVFKDRWEAARVAGDEERVTALLAEALEHYLAGHEADPSDPYPGINALTLMEWEAAARPRRDSLLAEVARAVAERQGAPAAGYWDHATHLELSIHQGDEAGATAALSAALAAPRTAWQVETTVRNLRLLREARERKGEPVAEWVRGIEERLR